MEENNLVEISNEVRLRILKRCIWNYTSAGWTLVSTNEEYFSALMQKVHASKVNHGLHIVLTLLTGLFWLPVYLLLVATSKNITRRASFFIDAYGREISQEGKIIKQHQP